MEISARRRGSSAACQRFAGGLRSARPLLEDHRLCGAPIWPVAFIRRRRSGNVCKNACWMCIFSCSPWRWERHVSARGPGGHYYCSSSLFPVRWSTLCVGPHAKRDPLLFREAPKTATAIDARGKETEVSVAALRADARLLIKPGAQFPVDAEIVKGSTAADESNLTGESAPVEKSVGDTALAGTINLWGAVEVVVPAAGGRKCACKKSSRSSRRLNSGRHPRSGSPTSSAPITPTACWDCRWRCSLCGGWGLGSWPSPMLAGRTVLFIAP